MFASTSHQSPSGSSSIFGGSQYNTQPLSYSGGYTSTQNNNMQGSLFGANPLPHTQPQPQSSLFGSQQQQQPYNQPNSGYNSQPQPYSSGSPFQSSTAYGSSYGAQQSQNQERSYMPGYMNATPGNNLPNRTNQSSFGSPAQHYPSSGSSGDDYGNASMDRDRSSPPNARGSLFGSGSGKKSSARLTGSTSIFGGSSRVQANDADEAPPIDSLHDLDDEVMLSGVSSSLPGQSGILNQETPTGEEVSRIPETLSSHALIIFGFAPDQISYILDHFRTIGAIIKIEPSSGNWATIHFEQAWQAARALRKNGEIIHGVMVGVKWASGEGPELPSGGAGTASNPQPLLASSSQHLVQHKSSGLGTPVPILGSNISDAMRKAQQPGKDGTPSRWLGGLMSTATATPAKASGANNPFTTPNAYQQSPRSGVLFTRPGYF